MIEDLNNLNSNILGNNALTNNSVSNIASKSASAYDAEQKIGELIDQGDISKEALEKYETEAEIAKYQSIVLDMLKENESSTKTASIADLLGKGEYNVDDATLAEAIFADEDAQNLLF